MTKKMILRKEYFGNLLHDPSNWGLKIISDAEAENLLKKNRKNIRFFNNKKEGYLSGPLKAFISISSKCNLHCAHCVLGKTRKNIEEIEFENFKILFKKLGDLGVLEVRLAGLEPTARKRFDEIFAEATKNGLVVSINTNGVLSDLILDKLIKSSVDKIHVSLDGLKENHNKLRTGGSFDKTLSTIKALKKSGKYVKIVTCLYRENVCDIDGLIELAEENECDIKFSPIAKVGSAEQMAGILNKSECEELKKRFEKINLEKQKHKKVKKINIMYSHGALTDIFSDFCDFFDFDSTFCGVLRTQMRVEPNKLIYAGGCTDLAKTPIPLGDINSDLGVLWDLIQKNLLDDFKTKEKCKNCDIGRVMKKWLSVSSPAFNFRRD
jgi:MoaA/NifB/PqqE/SkfB family radical SAM enzyme